MNYKHPADEKTLFQPYQQDLGWKYTVDTELAVQGDFFNCGVFMVGYFHCLLYGMNPRHLTPALMAEYRKRIFGAMHGAKVVEYGPSLWMAFNPVKRIQDPLPALANAVSRSIKNKRRVTCILNFEEFKKNAKKLRNARAAEQKQRRDTRVLKLVADAIAQKKMDESAKIQTQNIEAADEAVDILLLGGLGEHMKKKEGKKRDKHIKEFLDENLRAPSPGIGVAEPSEAPDGSEKDVDTSSQEQIAKLKFELGRSGEDPPKGGKTGDAHCLPNVTHSGGW
jgi:hypothetical protein